MLFPGRASTVREVGALSDLDNISVRIADVAARLAVLGDAVWLPAALPMGGVRQHSNTLGVGENTPLH